MTWKWHAFNRDGSEFWSVEEPVLNAEAGRWDAPFRPTSGESYGVRFRKDAPPRPDYWVTLTRLDLLLGDVEKEAAVIRAPSRSDHPIGDGVGPPDAAA